MSSLETGPIIPADFLFESELDVSFGMVYQGEPMSSGLKNKHLNIRTVEYRVVTW